MIVLENYRIAGLTPIVATASKRHEAARRKMRENDSLRKLVDDVMKCYKEADPGIEESKA